MLEILVPLVIIDPISQAVCYDCNGLNVLFVTITNESLVIVMDSKCCKNSPLEEHGGTCSGHRVAWSLDPQLRMPQTSEVVICHCCLTGIRVEWLGTGNIAH